MKRGGMIGKSVVIKRAQHTWPQEISGVMACFWTGRISGLSVAVLLCLLTATPARAFRGEESQEALRGAAVQVQINAAPAVRSLRQTQTLALAEHAGLSVNWSEQTALPISVRGKDLGGAEALSSGNGLRAKLDPTVVAQKALIVLDDLAGLFGITDAANEFVLRKEQQDKQGKRHLRFSQRVGALRVVGAELIVHVDAAGHAYEVNGHYRPVGAIQTQPQISGGTALRIAQNDLQQMGLPLGTAKAAPELVVYARDCSPCLAYELTIENKDPQSMPSRWRYWIDATKGDLLFRYQDIKQIDAPTENGQAAEVTGECVAGEGGAVRTIEGWQENTGIYYLYNPTQLWLVSNAWDYAFNFYNYPDPGTYAHRETNDWGDSDPIEVSAAYNVDVIQKYYQQVHGRNSYDDAGGMGNAFVHVGFFLANAFWDGTAMQIGDGDGVTCNSLAVLDIFGHEYTHAVTENTCDLVYAYESGALNESFSDIFGTCIEFFNQPDGRDLYPDVAPGHADWLMGEDSWLEAPAMRDLRNPANPLTVGEGNELPTLYKGTHWYSGTGDHGGVHENCSVQSYFFYLLCEGGAGTNDTSAFGFNVLGIGIGNAAQIAYQTLVNYCTSESDYSDIKEAWVSAAVDVDPRWVRSTRSAWNAVLGREPPLPMNTISPLMLPAARVGSWFTYTLKASYGVPDYTWAFLEGSSRPDWVTLAANGTLSGLPPHEAAGTNQVTVIVTDLAGEVATNQFSWIVNPAFTVPYAEGFEHDGVQPEFWLQTTVVNAQPWTFVTGSPYGYPSKAAEGTRCAELAVVELALTNTQTRLETPMIDFGTGTRVGRLTFQHCMANWENGQDELRVYYKTGYTEPWQFLAAWTNTTPYWVQRSVDLPNINRSYYLAFTGTANYGYGIHVDDVKVFDATLPLTLDDPATLPEAYTEREYQHALIATGGAGAYTFSLISGTLPTGLVMNAEGVISGRVDYVQSATFIVRVTDSVVPYATVEKSFTLNVVLPLAPLFEEDFEHYGLLPTGWTQENVTNGAIWACRSGGGNETQYNEPDHAHGGGYNAVLFRAETDTFKLNDSHITRFVTPAINLGEAPANVRMTFWHCMKNFAGGQDELRLYYKTSLQGVWTILASYTNAVEEWTERTVILPEPSSTYYLAFEGNARFGHGVCIDDILIHDGASAPVIKTDLQLPDGVKGLPYSYSLVASGGIEPYTWAVVSNALPMGLTLDITNGLVSGTASVDGVTEFRVSVAGADGYISTNRFLLKILPVSAGAFTENFDDGLGMPAGWSQQQILGLINWTFQQGSPEHLPATAHSPLTNAVFYANGSYLGRTRLISPMLNLGTSTTNALLHFWEYRAADPYAGQNDQLAVYYRTSPSGDWNLLTNLTGHVAAWTQRSVALPNTTTTYYLAFEGIANGGYGVGLDDIEITGDFAAGYEAWQNTHFTAGQLSDPMISDASADPDGDGLSNALEYAMGSNPLVADSEGLVTGGVSAGYLTLTFRMDKIALAAGTGYTVEGTTNLIENIWSSENISETHRDDSNLWWQVFYQHDAPVSTVPQRFMRLRITLP